MRLMPFERRFVLDTTDCPRCAGSGAYAHADRQRPRDCLNCRGLGRHPSHEALQVFYQVCELLGSPLSRTQREGRLEPRHLSALMGKQLMVGMRIQPTHLYGFAPSITWPRVVRSIERAEVRITVTLDDGSVFVVLDHQVFRRELTEEEIERVQAFMSTHVGQGVVAAA